MHCVMEWAYFLPLGFIVRSVFTTTSYRWSKSGPIVTKKRSISSKMPAIAYFSWYIGTPILNKKSSCPSNPFGHVDDWASSPTLSTVMYLLPYVSLFVLSTYLRASIFHILCILQWHWWNRRKYHTHLMIIGTRWKPISSGYTKQQSIIGSRGE